MNLAEMLMKDVEPLSLTDKQSRAGRKRTRADRFRPYLEGRQVTTVQLAKDLHVSRQAVYDFLTSYEGVYTRRVFSIEDGQQRVTSVWTWI
jgi:polynucleotide 5'-kinase involved in rRNA processing